MTSSSKNNHNVAQNVNLSGEEQYEKLFEEAIELSTKIIDVCRGFNKSELREVFKYYFREPRRIEYDMIHCILNFKRIISKHYIKIGAWILILSYINIYYFYPFPLSLQLPIIPPPLHVFLQYAFPLIPVIVLILMIWLLDKSIEEKMKKLNKQYGIGPGLREKIRKCFLERVDNELFKEIPRKVLAICLAVPIILFTVISILLLIAQYTEIELLLWMSTPLSRIILIALQFITVYLYLFVLIFKIENYACECIIEKIKNAVGRKIDSIKRREEFFLRKHRFSFLVLIYIIIYMITILFFLQVTQ